jgi:hypothetical protein
MRLTPVVLAYAGEPLQAIEKAAESSRTTHGSPMCIDACRYYAALIVGTSTSLLIPFKKAFLQPFSNLFGLPGALNGVGKEELLSSNVYSPAVGYFEEHPLVPEIDSIARGEYKTKQPPDIVGTATSPVSTGEGPKLCWLTQHRNRLGLRGQELGGGALGFSLNFHL